MSVNVTYFEPTPFFPPTQDSRSIQHVLYVALVEFFIPFAADTENTIHNPPEPPSPPLITNQRRNQMDSLVPKGKSSSAGSSQSSLDTTAPYHHDPSWTIVIRKGTHSTRNPHPIPISSITIPKNVKEAI